MVPFESLGAVSYSPSIVTMALSCISSEIKPDIGLKSWIFHTPLHSTPPEGVPVGILPSRFCGKTRMMGYPMVKKNFVDKYNRLHTIRACDGRTDGQTSCHGIGRAMHTRRAIIIEWWIRKQIPRISAIIANLVEDKYIRNICDNYWKRHQSIFLSLGRKETTGLKWPTCKWHRGSLKVCLLGCAWNTFVTASHQRASNFVQWGCASAAAVAGRRPARRQWRPRKAILRTTDDCWTARSLFMTPFSTDGHLAMQRY